MINQHPAPTDQLKDQAIGTLESKYVSLNSAIDAFVLLNELGISLEDCNINFDWVVERVLFEDSGTISYHDSFDRDLAEQVETNIPKIALGAIRKLERASHRQLSVSKQQQFLLDAAGLQTMRIADELEDDWPKHPELVDAIGKLASEWIWYEFEDLGDSSRHNLQEVLGGKLPRQVHVPPPIGTPAEIIASYGRALKTFQEALRHNQ